MSNSDDGKPVNKDVAREALRRAKQLLSSRSPEKEEIAPSSDLSFVEVTPQEDVPFQGTPDDLLEAFEHAAMQMESGPQYWSARRLQVLLGYESSWQNFENVITKAQMACHQSGQTINDHFNEVIKMVQVGAGGERPTRDIHVTRYGAYLVAQNGDSRKKQVAFAQTYFAVQARRQELSDEAEAPQLPEDQKRLMLREEIATHNKKLASAAKDAGVVQPIEFAVFQNYGYKGLYGGRDAKGIQSAKGLPHKSNILDHMGSTELAANLFRATQTEDKLRREKIQGKANANAAHFEVGKKVRKAIEDIGGTMPEELETAEDIGKVRRRVSSKAVPKSLK